MTKTTRSTAKDALCLGADPGRGMVLASGRKIVVTVDGDGERLEVLGPAGDLQVEIRFDAQGPVLRLTGARLDLHAVRSMTLRAEDIAVVAERSATVHGGVRVGIDGGAGSIRTRGDLDLRGRSISLNS